MAQHHAHDGHDHAHSHDHGHDHGHSHDHAHHHDRDAALAAGHGPSAMECCAHHELKGEKWIIPLLLGAILLITAFVARMSGVSDEVAAIPAFIAAICLGLPLFYAACQELMRGKPSSSVLAGVAILAAMAVQRYETAGWLAFILLFADQIVRRTASGAQRAIEALVNLTPDTARVVRDGEEAVVSLAEVRVGMTVRVRPGENLPVDGRVSSGRSTINQASLTGEAAPVEVQAGEDVYAGTTNLTGNIDLEVTQVGADTTIGKVSQLIREAENTRTSKQLLIEQVAGFVVPVALSVAAVAWFIKAQSADALVRADAAITAVTVLVVACPSALLLASPSALVAAFAAAARLGILIKKTEFLEGAANIDAVVLDKTGTITTGKFEVSRLAPAEGVDGAELLRAAAAGEQHSNHPLAQSILTTARAARVEVEASSDYEEIHGRGVRAHTPMGEVRVGRASWLRELSPHIHGQVEAVERNIEGMTGVHVMLGDRYLGAVGLEDRVKPGTRQVMEKLRELDVRTIAIFTGDRLSVAKRVGVAIGADSIEAECLPEEKHEQIRAMVREGKRVMMVGDGINDGPSLAEADVGVAMGLSGSDIAANSAGIALMTDDLNRIPFLMQLARRTRVIVGQNIAASIVIVVIGLVLAATGTLAVPLAAAYHFAGDVFVIANSFRLFRFGENFVHDAEGEAMAPARREASIRGLRTQVA
ncbi:MAG: cation-translocating P-type ATPase [Phycisphaerales bacterium]|jgi:heavy metal translocating P-type ATPase|nr:cation-translocating P-type ATPase [Phycisphaerales bacterium]